MAFKKTWTNKGSHWHSHKYDCISKNHQDYVSEYRILEHKGYSLSPLTKERNMV